MIRQHQERIDPAVTIRRTRAGRHTMVALDLDGLTYLLNAEEARQLADQLVDRAEEIA